MAENKPFYTEEDPEAGTHAGWIADSSTAQEIANIENNQGRNDALALERSLEASGMDPIEKENNDFVDLFLEKFPDIFDIRIDSKTGERYIATSESIFYKNIRDMYKYLPEGLDYGKVLRQYQERTDSFRSEPLNVINKGFYGNDTAITFSRHGMINFILAKDPIKYTIDIPYDPKEKNWTNFRDIREPEFLYLINFLAFYQEIAKEFHRLTDETASRRFSVSEIKKLIELIEQEKGTEKTPGDDLTYHDHTGFTH